MGYKLLKIIFRSALLAYHKRLVYYGMDTIPKDKPVLFLPNHQSALLDVLFVATNCNRKPFFLTRSDVFGKTLLNAFFKFLRMIPIYRIRDGRSTLSKNDAIFDNCAQVLKKGHAIVMFPEANHNLRRRVRPLSKGFTRVLFRALEHDPNLDIQIVPVGLNYKHAELFADEVAVYYGAPIAVRELYDDGDLRGSVERIKNKVSDRLQQLTTHIAPEASYSSIENALDVSSADYLKPRAVNAMVAKLQKGEILPRREGISRRYPLCYPIFLLLNLPVILIWKKGVKPKSGSPNLPVPSGLPRHSSVISCIIVYCS